MAESEITDAGTNFFLKMFLVLVFALLIATAAGKWIQSIQRAPQQSGN